MGSRSMNYIALKPGIELTKEVKKYLDSVQDIADDRGALFIYETNITPMWARTGPDCVLDLEEEIAIQRFLGSLDVHSFYMTRVGAECGHRGSWEMHAFIKHPEVESIEVAYASMVSDAEPQIQVSPSPVPAPKAISEPVPPAATAMNGPIFSKYAGTIPLGETSIDNIPLEEQTRYWASEGKTLQPTNEMSDEEADQMYSDWFAVQARLLRPEERDEIPVGTEGKLVTLGGEEIIGTFEDLTGTCGISSVKREKSGELTLQFAGETEIDWDEQKTRVNKLGERMYVTENYTVVPESMLRLVAE